MAKYIDKDAVMVEIERILDNSEEVHNSGYVLLCNHLKSFIDTLEVKEVDNVWNEIDNVNLPQPDKNKIYCVFTKDRYILATVINHPKDEELLQWKCTEFPHHRYDMCEGDKYMQIV